MQFYLKIFDPDLETVSALKSVFADVKTVTVEHVSTMLYLRPPPGIDVLYLPLAAAERWGSKPQIHESQVLATSPEDWEHGLPSFIVTGTCLAPEDPRGAVPETFLLIDSAVRAIRAFNAQSSIKLSRIGFWAYSISKNLTPEQVRDICISAIPELTAHRHDGTR